MPDNNSFAPRTTNSRKLGKPRLLIVGCGDIGTRVLQLLQHKYRVFALTTNAAHFNTLRAAGAVPLLGDLDAPASLNRLSGLAATIVHLAPPPKQGVIDTRTQHLLQTLSKLTKSRILTEHTPKSRHSHKTATNKTLIYGSTSGVYGDCKGEWIDETRPPKPANARAIRRLSAEQQCRNWARQGGHRTTILRIPGIYSANRLPITRIQTGTPALIADEDVYSNHIHADDLARIIQIALYRGRNMRVLHASDDSSLKMADYFDLIASWAGLANPPRLSMQELEKTLPELSLSFMRESRRMKNHRLKQELGFSLFYPMVADFLKTTTYYSDNPI